jgi:beta-glucosidase
LRFLRQLRERIDAQSRDTRLVVVVTGGGPLELGEVSAMADALLFAWYPGQEGGTAVGEILWGKNALSGKLPVTFPRQLADLPPYENYDMDGRTYRFMAPECIHYPFGYGLSYTSFSYDHLTVSSGTADVRVTNTGARDGETVVQIYARSERRGRLCSKLVGFQRLRLVAGETNMVRLPLIHTPEETHEYFLR